MYISIILYMSTAGTGGCNPLYLFCNLTLHLLKTNITHSFSRWNAVIVDLLVKKCEPLCPTNMMITTVALVSSCDTKLLMSQSCYRPQSRSDLPFVTLTVQSAHGSAQAMSGEGGTLRSTVFEHPSVIKPAQGQTFPSGSTCLWDSSQNHWHC